MSAQNPISTDIQKPHTTYIKEMYKSLFLDHVNFIIACLNKCIGFYIVVKNTNKIIFYLTFLLKRINIRIVFRPIIKFLIIIFKIYWLSLRAYGAVFAIAKF